MATRIDPEAAPVLTGTTYPPPYDEPCRARRRIRLGDAAGLTQFGVNLLRLPPGVWSAQRHWHVGEDEFIYVVSGEVVLVTDAGDKVLRAGDCAGFKAGAENGHCLQNRSTADATVLEVGTRLAGGDTAYYPECDLVAQRGGYTNRDGAPYPKQERRGA
jgi:uncharacterized cupin superfamily protein